MDENDIISPPVNFNCWKHHAGFIKEKIKTFSKKSDIILLKKHLLKIGESQMDLYFGTFTTQDISKQIITHLKKEKILEPDKYINWLREENNDHKLVQLSDNSIWILRLGENKERFVHIHPGRYSLHTTRVKATTLKTAILVLCFERTCELEMINAEAINQIRKQYLNEPPIKSFSSADGIRRLVNILRK